MKIRALFFLPLLLASCSVFGKMGEVEYNNKVVDQINIVSTSIEESATLYNESIPDLVNESSVIDITQMNLSYDESVEALIGVDQLLTYESRNIEQQNSVKTELQTYESAATAYLDVYGKMLDYYESKAYNEDLSDVEVYDEDLHTAYTTFIQANNDLVEILESYVSSN